MRGIDMVFPFRCDDDTDFKNYMVKGLTKRELFSAIAMNGLLSNPVALEKILVQANSDEENIENVVSQISCKQADSLIAELKEE